MRVVIAGAGIAGLTAASLLARCGHEIEIVERAPSLRTGGYMIDFFGSGYDVAERMGLLPELAEIHYPIPDFAFVRRDGSVRFTLEYRRLRALFGGRHFNFMRGDLERVLYERVEHAARFRFGASVQSLEQDGRRVRIQLDAGAIMDADIFIGADGLHSSTRALVFGDGGDARSPFERFLGYHAAAFVMKRSPDLGLRGDTFYTLTEPGRQVSLYPIRGGGLATLFIRRAGGRVDGATRLDPRGRLRHAFADMGWMVSQLLARLDEVDDVYYDDVSQVVMPAWSKGRIALVGDACQCVSLLAGQGASMAMAGAYVLTESLAERAGDVGAALARYEAWMKPPIERTQQSGRRMARWFVPESRGAIGVRDALTLMATWPAVSSIVRRRFAVESMFR